MMSSLSARLNIPQGRFPMLASLRRINPALIMLLVLLRSEERRVGKECVP